jgi:hypothetical protein
MLSRLMQVSTSCSFRGISCQRSWRSGLKTQKILSSWLKLWYSFLFPLQMIWRLHFIFFSLALRRRLSWNTCFRRKNRPSLRQRVRRCCHFVGLLVVCSSPRICCSFLRNWRRISLIPPLITISFRSVVCCLSVQLEIILYCFGSDLWRTCKTVSIVQDGRFALKFPDSSSLPAYFCLSCCSQMTPPQFASMWCLKTRLTLSTGKLVDYRAKCTVFWVDSFRLWLFSFL